MRRLVAAVVLLAACSSTPSTAGTGAGVATSVAVFAGAGQAGTPGSALPVRPAVVVRDGSGGAVSGVTVTFAIDSGGGSLSATTATTGSDGLATAGVWTLGAAPGDNVIIVTAGLLAPIRITAMAAGGSGTIPPVMIGSGGGEITTTTGPLTGFQLTAPAGALPTATQLTVSYQSTASFAMPAGATPISPVIMLSSSGSASYTQVPLLLHVAATVPPNTFPVNVMFDPMTGAREVLPTLTWDANGVTSGFQSLSSDNLSAAAGGSLRSHLMGEHVVHFITIAITDAALMADFDTGFRPGVDDWEFPPYPTVVDTSAYADGESLTELWYFVNHAGGGHLSRRFQGAADVEQSDRLGFRWTSEITKRYTRTLIPAIYSTLLAKADNDQDAADKNAFLTVRAAFALSLGMPTPQLMFLQDVNYPAPGNVDLQLVVYRASGQDLYVADADFPGDATSKLSFDVRTGAMERYPLGNASNPNFPAHVGKHPISVGLTSEFPVAELASTYAQVLDSTIGNGDFYSYQLRTQFGPVVGDTVWVGDSVRLWAECSACAPVITSHDAPEASGSLTGLDLFTYGVSSGGWGEAGSAKVVGYAFPPVAIGKKYTDAVVVNWEKGGDVSTPYWIDWHPYILVHLGDSVAAVVTSATADSIITSFSQLISGPLPPHLTYVWNFGDGSHPDTVAGTTTVTHGYAQPGTYPVTVHGFDPTTHQVIISSTILRASVAWPQYAWKFTSVTAPVINLPPGGIGSVHVDTLARDSITSILGRLATSPGDSRVFVPDSLGCRAIVLEQFAAGQAVDTAYVQSAARVIFGLQPAAGCTDPLFTSTLQMGTLGAGVLTGSILPNHTPGYITVAGGSINATMSGTILTGSFTWNVNYSTGVATYTVQFQGTQVLPKPADPPSGRRVKGIPSKRP